MTRVALADSDGLATVNGEAYSGLGAKKYQLRRFDSATGLSISGGATSEVVTYKGESWLKVTGVANTQFEVSLPAFSIPAPVGPHIVWIYAMEDWTKVATVLMYMGSTGYSGNVLSTDGMVAGTASARNGTLCLENNPWRTTNGGTNWSRNHGTTAAAKIRCTPQTGEVGVIYLHSVFFFGRTRANIVLGFDDNLRRISQIAPVTATLRGVSGNYTFKQILDAYGYRGTLWLVTGYIDGDVPATADGTLTWPQVNELVAAGWDAQVQTHGDPTDENSGGLKLYGPYGYAARSIASVDATTNAFTASATHYINTATYGYPIVFSGTDLPAPVVAGTTYWAKGTAATTFTIYPTRADMLADTNVIDLTTTGTAANFTFRYAGSANDHTAIQADLQACVDTITANVGTAPRFIAYNQGAVDEYVETAARNVGMKVSRTTMGATLTGSSYLFDATTEASIYPHQMNCTVYLDGASQTVAQYISAMASYVKAGYCINAYCHGGTATAHQNLANFCEAALFYESQGMTTVKTMSEYYDDRFSPRQSTSRLSA